MKLIVSGDRVFYTIQGEGTTLGYPVVFLRLHHCNLECTWCDAWYTWKKDTKEYRTEKVVWTIDEAYWAIEKCRPWHCKTLIISGGEPLIQQEAVQCLISRFEDWNIEIETNGTIVPLPGLLSKCQFNCSPKLAHSGTHSGKPRIVPEALSAISKGNATFKFVVLQPSDIDEIERDFLPHIKREQIILMPEGTTTETVCEHLQAVVEATKERGYRLTTRLQVVLWGNKRGV